MTPFRDRLAEHALGRHEAEAGARLHAGPHAGAAGARRAHDRRRPRLAPRLLAAPGAAAARRADAPAHHAVPRRGRALPARRAHGPRAPAEPSTRPTRCARPSRACWSSSWRGRAGAAARAAAARSRSVSEVEAFGERLHATLAAVPRRARRARPSALGAGLRAAGLEVEPARPTTAVARGRLHPPHPRRASAAGRRGGAAHESRRCCRSSWPRSPHGRGAAPPPPRAGRAAADARRRPSSARSPPRRALGRLRALRAAPPTRTCARPRARTRCPQVELGAGYTRQSDVPELILALPGAPPRTIFPNIPDNYRDAAGAVAAALHRRPRSSARSTRAPSESRAAADVDLRAGRADLVLRDDSAPTGRWSRRARASACCAESLARLRRAPRRTRGTASEVGLAARNEVLAVAGRARPRRAGRSCARRTRPRRGGEPAPPARTCRPATRVEPAEPLEAPRRAAAPTLERARRPRRSRARPERAALRGARRGGRGRASARERGARLPQVGRRRRLRLREPQPRGSCRRRPTGRTPGTSA